MCQYEPSHVLSPFSKFLHSCFDDTSPTIDAACCSLVLLLLLLLAAVCNLALTAGRSNDVGDSAIFVGVAFVVRRLNRSELDRRRSLDSWLYCWLLPLLFRGLVEGSIRTMS